MFIVFKIGNKTIKKIKIYTGKQFKCERSDERSKQLLRLNNKNNNN